MPPGVQVPVHVPFTQACFVHALGVPQLPSVPQPWTALPEHCVWPEAHVPAQTPFLQVPLLPQGLALLHAPFGVHVWTPLSVEHWVLPGAHEPAQAPLMQTWLVQATPAPHVPSLPHVCTPWSAAHCVLSGEHEPAHLPSAHA